MEVPFHNISSRSPFARPSPLLSQLSPAKQIGTGIAAERHSSIGRNAKVVEELLNNSNKSIGLSFSKQNRSKRSIRLKEAKENKDSNKEIESQTKIKFKGIPPKRKRNPSKFCEEDGGLALLQKENRSWKVLAHNGYLQPQAQLSIENFIVLRKLGEGSFSQVFQVVQRSTNALFALKVMEKEGLREMQVVDRLASQLKIQHFCNHLNIAKLYGVFHDDDRIYLIQEFAGSKTLFSLMESKRGKLALREVQAIVKQVCSAVRYLHSHSIIHRDIKPENILIAPGGVAKLTDFGWSVHNPDNSLRDTLCGTPIYLSPELISNQKYDHTVDLWAIGVLTFELFTGEMPFGIKSFQDLRNIVTEDIDLSGISDAAARSFISTLLTKQISLRKDINQICEHQFLRSHRCD